MNNKEVFVEFYQKPKLCSNIKHNIDFFSKDDKYNPFASINKYAEISIILNDNIYGKMIDFIMNHDLYDDKIKEIIKAKDFCEDFFSILKTEMINNNIEFMRSSRYCMQSAFILLTFSNMHSSIKMFFQLIGMSKRKHIDLLNLAFLKYDVQCI